MMNSPTQPSGPPDPGENRSLLRILTGPAAVLVLLIVVGRFAGRYWPEIETTVASLGVSGYVLFAVAWTLLSITFFPVSVMGVSAGALFGPWVGMAIVFPAGLAGGSAMFWLGRGLLRDRIRKMISNRPKLAAVDRLAGEQALKLNALTRLSPLNFGLASYTLAAGSTTYRAYFWGMFATLPSMMAQVWFGSLAREATRPTGEDGFSAGRMAVMIAGLLFFLGLTWMVGRMIKQAWDEAPDSEPEIESTDTRE